jgi:hypothetical protein
MRKLAAHAAILFCMLPASLTPAFSQTADERAVKAAYVFNLTKYVEWNKTGADLSICTLGDAPLADALQKTLSGKVSESRTIHVTVAPEESQLSQCQLIYVGHDASKKALAGLDKLHGHNILTVGDADAFAQHGGTIGLVRNGERIQIQVNVDAVQEAGLKLSSRLLNVAVLVHSVTARKD